MLSSFTMLLSEGMSARVSVGELVEVEVQLGDDRGIQWQPAKVLQLLSSQRFRVCVNGESDFLETFGPADEGKEWRRAPAEHATRVAAAYAEAEAAWLRDGAEKEGDDDDDDEEEEEEDALALLNSDWRVKAI